MNVPSCVAPDQEDVHYNISYSNDTSDMDANDFFVPITGNGTSGTDYTYSTNSYPVSNNSDEIKKLAKGVIVTTVDYWNELDTGMKIAVIKYGKIQIDVFKKIFSEITSLTKEIKGTDKN